MPGRVYIIPAGMDYQSRGGEGSAAQSYSILPNRSLFFREGVAKQLGSFPIAATHVSLNSSSALFISISSLDVSSLHAYLKNKYLLYSTSHYSVLCSLHKESPCKTHHKELAVNLL